MKRNSVIVLTFLILLFAFLWQLFFTWGFDFFWEDFDTFHLFWNDSFTFQKLIYRYCPNEITVSKPKLIFYIIKKLINNFFKSHRLYKLGINPYSFIDRPYQLIIWDLTKIIFCDNVIFHRIFKALIFSVNTALIFIIINRASLFLALLGVILYITSSEIWLSVLYICNYGQIAQGMMLLSMLLFLKLTEKKKINYKISIFYYLLIMIVSNIATLITSEGRYLAVIFFLTLLIFRRKELRFHLPMLLILFIMEFPILGYVIKILEPNYSPIDFTTHAHTNLSQIAVIKSVLLNYKIPLNALGPIISMGLFVTIFIQILRAVFNNKGANSTISTPLNPLLKERSFLFFLWLFSTFVMIARLRSFNYTIWSLQLYDLSFFIAPFIIFFTYYFVLINVSINKSQKKRFRVFILIIGVFLLTTQILYNLYRLNRFRVGWGNYFCTWQNAKKLIDKNSDKALALTFSSLHYRPFIFDPDISENKVVNTQSTCDKSEFCDLKFIESKLKEGFNDIFVVANSELSFRGKVKNVALIKKQLVYGNSGDLYDRLVLYSRLKNVIKRPLRPLYLYHFKNK